MSEEGTNVAEEIQQEEVVTPQDESLPPEEPQAPSEQSEESTKDYNFRQLRESKKQLERELQELRDAVSQFAKGQSFNQAPIEEDLELGDEDLVEGKHVKKLYSKIEKMIKERDSVTTEDRLRSKFSDFDQVVSRENIEKLKHNEPEIYASLVSGSDLYAKGVSAYKTLRALNIYEEDPSSFMNKEKAHKNHNKPVSTQSIKGHGAIHEANAFANGLTPELKKQLVKEMADAAKAR